MNNESLAFSYVRMSSEKQIKGDSLRRQLDWGRRYAADNGLRLDESMRDIGVSAWKGNNRKKGALGEFLHMVRNGEIPAGSFLLVESLDRLSRAQVMDALELLISILRSNITVVTMGPPEQIYTWDSLNGDFGQLIITLTVMARAHEESQRKSERIRSAFANKRRLSQEGIRTNSSPPKWITATLVAKGEFAYSLNNRAPLIQWIFQRSADGIGFDRIAKELNIKSEPTLKPGRRGWFFTSIANIVENRAAIGEYQPHESVGGIRVARGDPIQGYYPKVVSDELFLRAQKIRHRKRLGGRGGRYFTNLLDGLAYCTHCRRRMYVINNSPSTKQYTYLVCSAAFRQLNNENGSPACEEGTYRFRYDQVEQFILENVNEFGLSDIMQLGRADEDLRKRDEELAYLSMKLEDLGRRESRLLSILENEGVEDIPGLLALAKQRSQEQAETKALIETLRHDREVAFAKKQGLDPASAVNAMREAWGAAADENDRYGLRVRCNSAMRDFINSVQFNSRDGSYTVILFEGYRAYKFFNVPRVRQATQVPLVVDLQPLVVTGLWTPHAAHQKAPLSVDRALVNVLRDAAPVKQGARPDFG